EVKKPRAAQRGAAPPPPPGPGEPENPAVEARLTEFRLQRDVGDGAVAEHSATRAAHACRRDTAERVGRRGGEPVTRAAEPRRRDASTLRSPADTCRTPGETAASD